MDCLNGYIGLSSSVSTGSSGLNVDALPDISVIVGEKISVKQDQETDEEALSRVWENIEKRAIQKFRTLFFKRINECYKIKKADDIEKLICDNKELLSVSIWYLFGAEFMNERINSSRINRYTTVDKAKAKEIYAELIGLFTTELDSSIQGITPADSLDFEPESNNIISTHIPIL